MKIAILHGGSIRKDHSSRNAKEIYNDFIQKGFKDEVFLYEIDEKGNIFENKIKSDVYKLFLHIDHVLDTTFDYPGRHSHYLLLHKFNIKLHFHQELDNYEMRKVLSQLNIDHPNHYIIRKEDENLKDLIYDMWRKIHFPIKIKSNKKFASTVVTYNPQEALEHSLNILNKNDDVLIDDYSAKNIYVCFTIKNYRDCPVYITPIVEVLNNKNNENRFLSYTKPRSLSESAKSKAVEIVKDLSYHLDSDINKIEFTINKSGEVKILHISQKPDYQSGKAMYHVFKDYGISFADIIK
ncbi:MAG: hypothetical protein QG614_176 [Patescibacteria group bacterium]|nr:hypothetical protein [Patescibacteria group bacterium]